MSIFGREDVCKRCGGNGWDPVDKRVRSSPSEGGGSNLEPAPCSRCQGTGKEPRY